MKTIRSIIMLIGGLLKCVLNLIEFALAINRKKK